MARLSDEILAACKAEPMLIHTQDAHRIVGTIEALESDLAEAQQERNQEADRRIEMSLDRAEMMLNLAEAQAALAALVAMCRKCYTDPDTGVEFRPYAVIKDWPNLTALAQAHDAALLEQGRQEGYIDGLRQARGFCRASDAIETAILKIGVMVNTALACRSKPEPTRAGEPAGRPEGAEEGQADATT